MSKPWTERQLFEALQPVKHHFKGSTVNRNTVLAAHMRSRKLSPTGPAWTLAKSALDAGASFPSAAAQAEAVNSQASPGTSGARTHEPRKGSAKPASGPMRVPERTVTTRPTNGAEAHGALTWFPKKFGPGDMNGQGARRLLGTPNIPLTSVLVREMAQNSWDARTGNNAVRFTMNLRLLGDDEVRSLRSSIFTGEASALGLTDRLNKPEVWVLEIADRGTKGLGGPVRNDVAVRPDQVTNFADLILTLGAPRDVSLGAGTYGFGKTVAYRASACGTVLFWSRSREEGGIEDRVIGSAFGPAFNSHGLAFTGRHWWGLPVDDGIEPIRGQAACELASSVFDQGFEEGETGTSMLILDPDLGIGSPKDTAESIANAALWHLWPKMVEAGIGRTQMVIETLLNGEAISSAAPGDHSMFAGFSDCLLQVRSVQSGGSYTPLFNTSTHEIWLGKPRTLLGHLALTRYPFREEASTEDEVAVFSGPAHHVALMRHDAELVVKYVQGEPLNSPGFQWAGVFKPVADTDNSFADAEPPAHDDWSPAAIVDKGKRRQVNVALREIKNTVAEFLGPVNVGAANETPGRSVAALADELAGLLGGVHGSAPVRRPSKAGSRGGTNRGASAKVEKTWSGPVANGRRLMALQVTVDGYTQPVRVRADAGVGVEGAMDHDESRVVILGWVPGADFPDLTVEPVTAEAEFEKGDLRWLLLDADSQVSVDVNLRVGGEQ